jgi:hypothetical protein
MTTGARFANWGLGLERHMVDVKPTSVEREAGCWTKVQLSACVVIA